MALCAVLATVGSLLQINTQMLVFAVRVGANWAVSIVPLVTDGLNGGVGLLW